MTRPLTILDRRQMLLLGAATAAMAGLVRTPVWASTKATEAIALKRDQPFDLDWRFYRGEGAFEASSFDDQAWRHIDLPHDFSIEDLPKPWTADRFGPFDKSAVGGTGAGFTVGGEGWYRKRFVLPAALEGSRVGIQFGGVAVLSDVWVNGRHVGAHAHAYTTFSLDLTPFVSWTDENVIAVRARNVGQNSRWYAGSGLYRSVTLDVTPGGARLARRGVSAWTRAVEDRHAELDIVTRVESPDRVSVRTSLRDASGRIVARETSTATEETRQTLVVNHARLWSPDTPYLYTLETELLRGGRQIDRIDQSFGIRIVTMDPEQGLQINGKRFVLRGGCVHHDNGLLGAATFADADDRRVRLHKARGFNAFRSAHNPASGAFLEACDRHGMLVIEEAFDSWHIKKRAEDYSSVFASDWREDLEAMVVHGRNHPSIIMWSIGNEIPERTTDIGLHWAWTLANTIKSLDQTRPTTAALHAFLGRPLVAAEGTARAGHAGEVDQPSTVFVDVAGYNYKLEDIERDHSLYPSRVIYASETYASNAYDYRTLAERAPYFLGEFVWTSMDYVGEAGLGLGKLVPEGTKLAYNVASFPVYNAFCGDIDLIGNQKSQSRFRDVVWGLSALEIAVERPEPAGEDFAAPLWGWPDESTSWTWPDHIGEPLTVRAYTSGDRVELTSNGVLIESRVLGLGDRMTAEFKIPYQPGTLEAIAFRDGREIARQHLATSGPAASLAVRLEPICGQGRQALCYVNIEVLDAEGRPVPDAAMGVDLKIEGPAELIGFGSASPMAVGSFQAMHAQTFNGRALAILRGGRMPGGVNIRVEAEGLTAAEAALTFH